jgi:hypothetical protein
MRPPSPAGFSGASWHSLQPERLYYGISPAPVAAQLLLGRAPAGPWERDGRPLPLHAAVSCHDIAAGQRTAAPGPQATTASKAESPALPSCLKTRSESAMAAAFVRPCCPSGPPTLPGREIKPASGCRRRRLARVPKLSCAPVHNSVEQTDRTTDAPRAAKSTPAASPTPARAELPDQSAAASSRPADRSRIPTRRHAGIAFRRWPSTP